MINLSIMLIIYLNNVLLALVLNFHQSIYAKHVDKNMYCKMGCAILILLVKIISILINNNVKRLLKIVLIMIMLEENAENVLKIIKFCQIHLSLYAKSLRLKLMLINHQVLLEYKQDLLILIPLLLHHPILKYKNNNK